MTEDAKLGSFDVSNLSIETYNAPTADRATIIRVISQCVAVVIAFMDNDRKIPALKNLQVL